MMDLLPRNDVDLDSPIVLSAAYVLYHLLSWLLPLTHSPSTNNKRKAPDTTSPTGLSPPSKVVKEEDTVSSPKITSAKLGSLLSKLDRIVKMLAEFLYFICFFFLLFLIALILRLEILK